MARARPTTLALLGAIAAAQAAVVLLRPRGRVITPAQIDTEAYFSAADVRRARAYRRPQLALALAQATLEAALLARLARQPPALIGRTAGSRPLFAACAYGAGLSVTLAAAGLPLGAIGHMRATRVGLATQGWRAWLADAGRSTAVGTSLAAAGSGALLALQRRAPRNWWLPGSAAALGVSAAFLVAGPVLLDPIFNRFTPLPAGPLRDEVLALSARAGVAVREVFEVDASRRTTGANAYVTGLGPTKRIVLFDTLIERFTPGETRLVVAHELAHVSHRDVPRGLALVALTAPAALYAAQRISESLTGGRAGAESLPAVALALGVVSAAIGPVAAQLSRAIERRADEFALELTREPAPFVAFERRIVTQNLADPAPSRLLTALLASHPPAVERIGAALAFARREGLSVEAPVAVPATPT
jgi:Zn-dependent protease with chaperone function